MTIDVRSALTRAATHLDRSASLAGNANELELPKLLFRGRAVAQINETYARAVDQGRLAIAQLDGVSGPAGDAMRGVDELLAKIDPGVPRPKHKGLEWARRYGETSDVAGLLGIRADRMRLIADHVDADPAFVRAALGAETANITGKPLDQVTRADMRRLAAIDGLPEALRPPLPPRLRDVYSPEELVVRNMLPGTDNIARGEFEMHRVARMRAEIGADAAASRESLDAEVRTILATPDAHVTMEMTRRLSAIAGLGDDLRPSILDTSVPWSQHKLEDLSAWGWLPARDSVARTKFNALRMAIEQEALIADPAVTRESVTHELAKLLAIPQESLTDAQLYRTSLLARLPANLRPPMPARLDHYAFEDLGLLKAHPARHLAAAKVFDQMRIHMAAVVDPELVARQLGEQVKAGQRIDFRVIAALEGQEALLARHGLTSDVLNREAVRSLAGAGAGSKDALLHHLQRVRDSLTALPANDEKTAAIRAQALELADRNIERMAGTRIDTFGRHPDYAEVGRLVSIAELLEVATRRPTPASPSAASTTAASTTAAAGVLTW